VSDAVDAGGYLALTLALLAAGTALVVLAPRHPMVVGPGEHTGGFAVGMWPLLAVLALVAPVLAVVLLLARRREAALGLVAVVGLLAGCRFVADLALLVSPATAQRAELWMPHGIDPVRPGPGVSMLLAGQLCTAVAGVVAVAESARREGGHRFDPWPGPCRATRSVIPIAVSFAVLAGAGLLAAPWRSTSPYVSARSAFDAPISVSLGAFVLAAGVVLAAGLAGSSPDHRVAVAGLVATALTVVGVALPRVVVAALAPELGVAPGPVVALLGALGLAVSAGRVSVWPGTAAWAGTSAGSPARIPAGSSAGGGRGWSRRLLAEGTRVLAGLLCLISGGCGISAFLLHPLRLAADLPQPRIPTTGLLLCTGVVVAAAGWGTAMPPYGRLLRPALGVVAMAMPMAAAEYVAAVCGVLDLPGVDAGPGSWFAFAAALTALAAGLLAVISGGFDRDDVDLTGRSFSGPSAPVAAGAAVLAVPAFALPLVNGTGRGVTGVFQAPFGLPSWALLCAMSVTVGVGLLGPRCRPAQAAVLYTGACVLLVLRLARVLFGPRPLPTTGPAEGVWASVLCLLLLLAAATIAAHTAQSGAPGGSGALSSARPTMAISRRLRS